jgi:hypothetical protein
MSARTRVLALAIFAVVAISAEHAHADASLADAVAAGRQWRLDTPHGAVHVWIPASYEPTTASTIVYVHGYYTNVDDAWTRNQLPEQFALSGINGLFIACEAPSRPQDPVAWRSLRALLATVRTATVEQLPRGHLVAIGHSGAYRTLIPWLENAQLDTVVLVDAAYEPDPFRWWTRASRRHRLIDIGEDTRRWTEPLHRALPSVVLDEVPPPEAGALPPEAAAARIVYIRSTVGHMPLVTGGVVLPMVLRAISSDVAATPFPLGVLPARDPYEALSEPDGGSAPDEHACLSIPCG